MHVVGPRRQGMFCIMIYKRHFRPHVCPPVWNANTRSDCGGEKKTRRPGEAVGEICCLFQMSCGWPPVSAAFIIFVSQPPPPAESLHF